MAGRILSNADGTEFWMRAGFFPIFGHTLPTKICLAWFTCTLASLHLQRGVLDFSAAKSPQTAGNVTENAIQAAASDIGVRRNISVAFMKHHPIFPNMIIRM